MVGQKKVKDFLAVSLREHAQSVLGDLPSDESQYNNTLVRSLEERFSPQNQTDLYRVQLKERRQKASHVMYLVKELQTREWCLGTIYIVFIRVHTNITVRTTITRFRNMNMYT